MKWGISIEEAGSAFKKIAMPSGWSATTVHPINLYLEDDAEINTTRNIEYPQPSSKRGKFKKRGRK